MNHLVPRDEREQGIDRAADRLAYLVLSFGLLAIVRASAAGREGITYLLVARRSRLDRLPVNLRGKARAQLLESARTDLERSRSLMEPRPTEP